MTIKLYMDHQVKSAITKQLRRRGVDVITAYEDGTNTLADPLLLDRATALNRVLFTQDRDHLQDAAARQQAGAAFAGVIYAHKVRVTIGQCVRDLELIAKACDPMDLAGKVTYLPL